MYTAIGNQIFIHGELFITIHPTNSTVAPDEQAKLIASLLNNVVIDEFSGS